MIDQSQLSVSERCVIHFYNEQMNSASFVNYTNHQSYSHWGFQTLVARVLKHDQNDMSDITSSFPSGPSSDIILYIPLQKAICFSFKHVTVDCENIVFQIIFVTQGYPISPVLHSRLHWAGKGELVYSLTFPPLLLLFSLANAAVCFHRSWSA